MVLITIVSSGLPLSVSKLVSLNKDEKKGHSVVFNALVIISLVSVFICLIVLLFPKLFITILTNKDSYFMLLSLLPAVISSAIYSPFKGYLWGKEKFFLASMVELIEQILKIFICFLMFICFKDMGEFLPIGLSTSIACILTTALGIIFFYIQKGKLKRDKTVILPLIKSALPLSGVRLFSSLTQPIISIILTYQLMALGFSHEQVLSQIGIAMGLTLPILSIPGTLIGSLAMALIPRISNNLKENNTQSMVKQIYSSYIFTICCIVFSCIIFWALGDEICLLLYGNFQAGTFLINATWIMLPMGISQLTTSILNSLNLEFKTFKFYIFSSIIMIFCVVFLPKFVGVYALIISMGLSMALICMLNFRTIKKHINYKRNFYLPILYQILLCIPISLLTKWLFITTKQIFTNIFAVLLTTVISFIIYVMLLFAFNIIDFFVISSYFKKGKSVKIKNK